MTQAEMPSEFFDITSARLLTAPRPQYLYAGFWKSAQAVDLGGAVDMGGRTLQDNGAPYSSADRDRLMLSNPLATSVVATPMNNMSGAPGSTMKFNRPVFSAASPTEATRRIPSGASITTTPITPEQEQNKITVYRYGGPYDVANSRVAPFPIESFDAQFGIHKQMSMVDTHLKDDFDKFIDNVQVALLDNAASVVYPTGAITADDDIVSSTGSEFDYAQLCRVERLADDSNRPVFDDGFRLAVLHPIQVEQLKNDTQYARYAAAHREYNSLFPGYVGSVGKTHIFKSTTLTVNNHGSGVNVYRGHYLGPDVLMGGLGRMPRVARSTDDNYGETNKLIWLADLAFGLADDRFVTSIRSAGDQL